MDTIVLFVTDPPARFKPLLLWSDPVKSGAVLGGATAAFIAVRSAWSNLSYSLSFLALIFTATSFIYANLQPILKAPPLPVPKFVEVGITETDVEPHVRRALIYVNKVLGLAHEIVSGKNWKKSAAVFGSAFAASKVARLVSFFTLAYASVVLLFVAPLLYHLKRAEIDQAAGVMKQHLNKVHQQLADLRKKIPVGAGAAVTPEKKEKKEE